MESTTPINALVCREDLECIILSLMGRETIYIHAWCHLKLYRLGSAINLLHGCFVVHVLLVTLDLLGIQYLYIISYNMFYIVFGLTMINWGKTTKDKGWICRINLEYDCSLHNSLQSTAQSMMQLAGFSLIRKGSSYIMHMSKHMQCT